LSAASFLFSQSDSSDDYIQSVAAILGVPVTVKDKIPFRVRPMLATLVNEPFHAADWVYEEKYDGIRILTYKEGPRVRLLSRNDKDRTASFPAIASAISALGPTTLLLDGEVIALDRDKISRFQLLQRGTGQAHYAVFDCLYVNGRGLRQALYRTVARSSSGGCPRATL
jgi:bifunctional non-homologous end joining protein LigD